MSQNPVQLYDRIKEITYTQGTINFALARTADGFSSLERFYAHNDVVFYAATDGVRYEVGSGVFLRADFDPADDISYNELLRHPFRSSNPDNSIVDFPPGAKEVFITYPATHSVMMGSGLPDCNVPQRKGIAVWEAENTLNYFPNLVFDKDLGAIGVNQPSPVFGLDLGGSALEYSSRVRASGYFVGPTGIEFKSDNGANASLGLTSSPYQGGTQYVHFAPNKTDSQLTEGTNSHLLLAVSGEVNEYILLQKQTAHTIFAGPIDDCDPSCAEDYPLFRNLVLEDLPLAEIDTYLQNTSPYLTALSGNLEAYADSGIFLASGYLQSGIDVLSSGLDIHISGYESDFRDLEIAISGKVDTYLHSIEHENPYCTVRGDNVDGYNAAWNHDNQSNLNYAIFPFSHVESASEVSDWDTTNYWYTVPRSGTYAVKADIGASYVSGDGDVDNYFRLVTSGDGSVTNYLSTAIFMGDPADNNASSSWTVNVPSGELIYLEYQGQPRNFSKLSIYKI